MTLVISQSMYFPWVGMLEQIRLADVFMHYDDVQLARGFYNRVQVKTAQGARWLTVPLRDKHQGQRIDETRVDERVDWRSQHRDILRHAYRHAPACDDMLALADSVWAQPADTLADVSRQSMRALADYFSLSDNTRWCHASEYDVPGASSERLLGLCRAAGARTYLTGHGARNYLDHERFERAGIDVRYMDYQRRPYAQQFGAFDPHVTGLDLVANLGRAGIAQIVSGAMPWRDFLALHAPQTLTEA